MPTYDYECKSCLHSFETRQSIREDSLVQCPECGRDELRRVLYPVQVFAKGEPTTLGSQADHNMARMGSYERQEKRHEIEVAKAEAQKVVDAGKPPRPWWRKSDTIDTKLAAMAPKVTIEKGRVVDKEPLGDKAVKYIMEGKK